MWCVYECLRFLGASYYITDKGGEREGALWEAVAKPKILRVATIEGEIGFSFGQEGCTMLIRYGYKPFVSSVHIICGLCTNAKDDFTSAKIVPNIFR